MFKKALVLPTVLLLLLLPAISSQANDVVVLKSADIKPYEDALNGFRKSCGCSIREVEPRQDDILKKLSGRDPDMVFAIGLDALSRARVVKDLPVIYSMVLPSEIPGSLGKNVSGVSMYISPERYLGMMEDVLPGAKRIGIIYDPGYSDAFVREAIRAAGGRGIQLVLKKAGRSQDVPSLIDAMRGRIDAFWMLPDITVVNPETVKYLLLFSFRNKVPVFTFSNKYVEMGALAALNIVPYDIGVQAGELAKKLSNGQNGGAPIRVDARKTVLSINRTVAAKLGINISDDTLKRADYVY